jgi:hypothetical protein
MPPIVFHPICSYEDINAEDFIDGLQTLSGRSASGTLVYPPGNGPDEPLNWSTQEISQAQFESGTERNRLITNAVINSRRALACLTDWYMSRDMVNLCAQPATTPKQQAEYLTKRGIIDDLTARVLERAIDDRNRVEHDFTPTSLERAEDIVELLRRTMFTLRANSDPSYGPMIFGSYLGGWGWGDNGPTSAFHGWNGPLVVFSRFSSDPWVGIVIPSSEAEATVRRTYLKCLKRDQLLQIHTMAEQRFSSTTSFSDPETSRFRLSSVGLLT